MNRKGIFGLSWSAVIGLSIALIIIVGVIVPLSGRLLGLIGVGSEQDESAAKSNLVALSALVNQLLVEPESYVVFSDFQFGLPEDFILIAFNKDEDTSTSLCDSRGVFGSGARSEEALRPDDCKVGTCLCVYEDTVGIDFDEEPIMCQPFPSTVAFLGPGNKEEVCGRDKQSTEITCFPNPYRGPEIRASGEKEVTPVFTGDVQIATYTKGWNFGKPISNPHTSLSDYDHENLVIYGTCEKTVWGIQPIYLEKFNAVDQKKSYVYISRQSSLSDARYAALSKKLVQPPSIS